MSNKQNDTLIDAIKDIGYPIRPEFELHPSSNHESLKAGPNSWDDVQPEDFGPEHDFELYDHYSLWVFFPVSKAALQWCYKHLPEDCPRWGSHGFAIETRYIKDVVDGARRDGLMSEKDYIDAMEEANALQHQGVEE